MACLFFSGCVYYRLWQIQRQLSDFSSNFTVKTSGDGLTLHFKNPVLLSKDMEFFDLAPKTREKTGTGERWEFLWRKTYRAPGENPGDHEIAASLLFIEDRLASITLPEYLFAYIPKHAFAHYLRAFGDAKINKLSRTAKARVDKEALKDLNIPPVNAEVLEKMLGEPRTIIESGDTREWRYRYRGVSPKVETGDIDAIFLINPKNQSVTQVILQLTTATIQFEFTDKQSG